MEKKNYYGRLGNSVTIDTMVFMNGMYFALRSGGEHRNLRHDPPQIELVEKASERAYLKYTEDISKNHPGGLKGRKHNPKVVLHHETPDNPLCCFVRLFKLYQSKCPPDRPPGAFYLKPLKNPQGAYWYAAQPIGFGFGVREEHLDLVQAQRCQDFQSTVDHQFHLRSGVQATWEDVIPDLSFVSPLSHVLVYSSHCLHIHVLHFRVRLRTM